MLLLVGIGLYAMIERIDRKVAARIHSVHTPKLPVIYSAPFDLSGFTARIAQSYPHDLPALRAALAERRYSEVVGAPSRPGEYSLRDDVLRISARSYVSQTGEMVPEREATIRLEGQEEPLASPLWLEPQVVSYIGSADMRASSFIPLSNIPPVVQHAVIAIEDERFYEHFGLDLLSIGRALLTNLRAMRVVQGGSTLTQQLAKNMFLSPKKTISRKLLEIPTALSLERHLTKSELLELYLNEVYLGQEGAVAIHGMFEAASAFFGKKLEDLHLEEAATLAAIIKAPSYFNPRRFPDRARERRDTVLVKMKELGYISEADASAAMKRALKTVPQQEHRRLAPYYVAALESELSEVIDIDNASATGLVVHTGLDLGMQRCAEQAVERGLKTIEKAHPKLTKDNRSLEAALVAIEPYSGLVKSWVGGRDFSQSQFNRVVQANRQVGSTIKPFLYLTALDGSLNSYKVATAASILEDKPIEFHARGQKAWNPENFDHEFRGDVTVRYALEHSLNMPALYIAERVGIPAIKKTVSAFKLATQVQALPSLALGALDTNLLRLTAAYGALANGGVYLRPRAYISALDSDNARLSAPRIVEERVADENATYVLTTMMQGVVDRGTAASIRRAGFTRPAAGKTGTSDSARDAWFVGFTPNLVAGVWVGFDDNSPLNLTGGGAAAPIWGDFMRCSSAFLAESNFIAPQGVHYVQIDASSGLLATERCDSAAVVEEIFVKGTEPRRRCLHDGREPAGEEPVLDSKGRESFWSRFLP
jgi:penicillin-binding protein 1B